MKVESTRHEFNLVLSGKPFEVGQERQYRMEACHYNIFIFTMDSSTVTVRSIFIILLSIPPFHLGLDYDVLFVI